MVFIFLPSVPDVATGSPSRGRLCPSDKPHCSAAVPYFPTQDGRGSPWALPAPAWSQPSLRGALVPSAESGLTIQDPALGVHPVQGAAASRTLGARSWGTLVWRRAHSCMHTLTHTPASVSTSGCLYTLEHQEFQTPGSHYPQHLIFQS